jgi:hypothetical protein
LHSEVARSILCFYYYSRVNKQLLVVGLICIGAFSVQAQSISAKIDILESRGTEVFEHHDDSYVAHILSGKKYQLRYLGAVNSQFFLSDEPSYGTMVYDGTIFNNIELQYDLFAQKIIVLMESKRTAEYVSIDKDKVAEFSVNDCRFVNVRQDSIMEDGIYQLAFEGKKSNVYIKRIKKRIEKVDNSKLIIQFSPISHYYIKNEFGSYKVSGKKDVLFAYQNSNTFKSMLKQKKIKFFKSVKEQGIINAVSLFDSELATN